MRHYRPPRYVYVERLGKYSACAEKSALSYTCPLTLTFQAHKPFNHLPRGRSISVVIDVTSESDGRQTYGHDQEKKNVSEDSPSKNLNNLLSW